MPAKRQKRETATQTSAATTGFSSSSEINFQSSSSNQTSISQSTPIPSNYTDEQYEKSLALIDCCSKNDFDGVRILVEQDRADAWIQDDIGWTSLHHAASVGDTDTIIYLLRSGNAVWNIVDNIGCTAGDIAYSMSFAGAYTVLFEEGVRSEMLKAVMSTAAEMEDSEEHEEETTNDESHNEQEVGKRISNESMDDMSPEKVASNIKEGSTSSHNQTFLSSKLIFRVDPQTKQEICEDREGNGVMMGWETGIMKETAHKLCEPFEHRKSRKGKPSGLPLEDEETGQALHVLNVGFGLGIIDSFLQEYEPEFHLIIEPHPDVLEYARSKGWYEKPGVQIYEGTWQQYQKALSEGTEEWFNFDAIYFDTYSEHYADLHAFFDLLPNLLASPASRFSFFHGLGATSRLFYDVYTEVSELHLREIGLSTEWEDVKVGTDWGDLQKKYWNDVVGNYRLPICKMSI